MVLPQRESRYELGKSGLHLDGSRNADVKRFLFKYENVIMGGMEEEEKELNIVCYVTEKALNSGYEECKEIGELPTESKD